MPYRKRSPHQISEVAEGVEDESEFDDEIPSPRYDITSYGWDADVDGLVRRLRKEEILVPSFQRDFVWKLPEASRFVESLLLGLPVPGIFLAIDPDNKQFIIDGQQRLRTLQFFYEGYFNPNLEEKRRRVFTLTKVQPTFDGKTYETLDARDRRRLDNSIIPATIIKQESPPGDDTSIYHIFERLNSGGRKLTPQQIRSAIYHGSFVSELRRLNDLPGWRAIFGKRNPGLKDQELILRFLALYYASDDYKRPMSEFLNIFNNRHRHASVEFLFEARRCFQSVTDLFWAALKKSSFRPGRALNAAVFDSTMVGLARRIASGSPPSPSSIKEAYEKLLSRDEFIEKTSRSTADEAFVEARLRLATDAFADT